MIVSFGIFENFYPLDSREPKKQKKPVFLSFHMLTIESERCYLASLHSKSDLMVLIVIFFSV